VSIVEELAETAMPTVAGERGANRPIDWSEGSMLREVAQSCYLMALLAGTLSAFVGLGLLAMWLLG
jgi:hypothetical protein